MFQIGENGSINPMGEAPSKLTTASLSAMGGGGGGGHGHGHGHGHSAGCCEHHGGGGAGQKSVQEERDPLGMGAVVQRYTPHPKDAGGSALYDNEGRPVSVKGGAGGGVGGARTKREELQEKVFQPGWRQPTESLQEYCDRMMPHAVTGWFCVCLCGVVCCVVDKMGDSIYFVF